MAKQTKNKGSEEHDIASRLLQIAGIIGAVTVVIFAPDTADQLTIRIVTGILAGIGLGARPEDVKEVFLSIFGRGGKDD